MYFYIYPFFVFYKIVFSWPCFDVIWYIVLGGEGLQLNLSSKNGSCCAPVSGFRTPGVEVVVEDHPSVITSVPQLILISWRVFAIQPKV